MNSYTDVDGVPVASDPALLTDLLRDAWGFTGTVVSDYGAVTFLQLMHRVAEPRVRRPHWRWPRASTSSSQHVVLRPPLLAESRLGRVDEALVDRALRRVLRRSWSSGCSTRAGRRSPGRGHRLRLRRETVTSPANGRVQHRAAGNPTGVLPLQRRSGLRSLGRAPTTRRRSSAATPSPIT